MERLKHIIEAQQFSRDWLEKVFFKTTDEMRGVFEAGGSKALLIKE